MGLLPRTITNLRSAAKQDNENCFELLNCILNYLSTSKKDAFLSGQYEFKSVLTICVREPLGVGRTPYGIMKPCLLL